MTEVELAPCMNGSLETSSVENDCDSLTASSETSSPPTTPSMQPPNKLDLYGTTTDSGHGTSESSPTEEMPPQPVTSVTDILPELNGAAVNGPDAVLEAERLYTWMRDQPVMLRMAESGPLAEKPISVPTLVQSVVKKIPNKLAIAVKRGGAWKEWTYQQYYDDIWQAAKAFIKLGLEPYHGVGIIGFNSPEWFISDLAAIFAGGFAAGVYTTNSPEACEYVVNNCEANIVVVENNVQLQKILKVRANLPHLRAIVQYTGELKEKYEGVYTWSEFMEFGNSVSDDVLQQRLKQQAPNKCCTLIYTSGTTGNPKGVMLSHDNIVWTARVVGQAARLSFGSDVCISYLPLSHVAAQVVDIYGPIVYGAAVYFAQADALKGSLATTMKEVQPTIFLGVPRVWEKMQEKMVQIARNASTLRRKVAAWAKGVGLRGNMSVMEGSMKPGSVKPKRGSLPFGWTLANKLVFTKVREGLGLTRCKICVSAAAPIMRDTLEFFMSLNIPVTEIYGMSESTGPHTVSFPWKFRLASVGQELPGCSTRLDQPDKDGNGEILMSGRHVFMGYLNEKVKTEETLTEEGWLKTGDVGKKDDKGFLYITGRIKELLITAGGENVAPVPIEDNVKMECPIVSNCMLIGDKKKFLAMLISLKCEVESEGMPKDELTRDGIAYCQSIGSKSTKVSEVLEGRDTVILEAIQSAIDRANKKSPSNAQKIQKWSILPRDFSIPGGELGPTLKLKRPVVSKMYKNTIDSFYEGL